MTLLRILAIACTLPALAGCALFRSNQPGPGRVQEFVTTVERVHVEAELARERSADAVRALQIVAGGDFGRDAVTAYEQLMQAIGSSEGQADVLATTAVRYGQQAEQTKAIKRAATDVIWSAGAKVTREERAEVIRRLPPLLKTLRDGMASAGMSAEKQDEHIQVLNNSLAAAFTAKAAVIPSDRLDDLTERLESLEELLPDAADVKIDESIVLDLSGHESSELEVVAEGGSMPTPAMLAWARELQVGSWYMLDYRGRNEPVQLSWQGMRRQLSLFVTPQGRCVLFQQQRLAAFLQAGLLLPAQEESLTVRATRTALAKLDADPSRLLN